MIINHDKIELNIKLEINLIISGYLAVSSRNLMFCLLWFHNRKHSQLDFNNYLDWTFSSNSLSSSRSFPLTGFGLDNRE